MSDVIDLNEYRELKAAKKRNEEYMRSVAARDDCLRSGFWRYYLFKPEPPEATK
jgi:hypothetical protein